MRERGRMLVCGLCVALTLACAGGDEPSAAPTALAWRDSVQLREFEHLALTVPGGFALWGIESQLVVTDVAAGVVFVFGRDGLPRQRFSRRGRGPGELLAPGSVEVWRGDTIVLTDNATARLAIATLSGSRILSATRIPAMVTDVRRGATGLTLGAVSVETGRSFLRWRVGDSTFARGGQSPQAFLDHPRLLRNLALPVVATRGDSSWVGLAGDNAVSLYAGADTLPVRSIELPRVRRRGVPLDDGAWLGAEMSQEDELSRVSVLTGLGLLTDGRLVAVHVDFTFDAEGRPSRQFYVSVIDASSGKGCHDLALPLEPEGIPLFRVHEDVLYAVAQRLGADDEGETWWLSLPLTDLRCT